MAGMSNVWRVSTLAAICVLLSLAGCVKDDDGKFYTLYRDSVTGAGWRIHVATFDASDGEDYNRQNCDIARELFQSQQGVQAKYWCEKGRYRR